MQELSYCDYLLHMTRTSWPEAGRGRPDGAPLQLPQVRVRLWAAGVPTMMIDPAWQQEGCATRVLLCPPGSWGGPGRWCVLRAPAGLRGHSSNLLAAGLVLGAWGEC